MDTAVLTPKNHTDIPSGDKQNLFLERKKNGVVHQHPFTIYKYRSLSSSFVVVVVSNGRELLARYHFIFYGYDGHQPQERQNTFPNGKPSFNCFLLVHDVEINRCHLFVCLFFTMYLNFEFYFWGFQ